MVFPNKSLFPNKSQLKIGYKIYNFFKVDNLFYSPAKKRQKLGLVGENRKKISQIINDDL
jgi:hypothetical protein